MTTLAGPQLVRARADVAVWRGGTGPAVLLIPTFPDHAIGMLRLAARLADAGFSATVMSLPGVPPSVPVDGDDYAVPRVAADAVAVMQALGHERFAVVGHGWGAEIGYHLGAHAPQHLTTLTAISVPHPAGYAPRRTVFSEQRSAGYAMFLAYSPAAAEIAAQPAWLTSALHHWAPGIRRDDWDEVLGWIADPEVIRVISRYYRQNLEADLDASVVQVPTTTIHGGQSTVISPTLFNELGSWFGAGYRRHLVPHVGQWPHREDEALVHDLIVASLRDPPAMVEPGA